jgi:hypothetical protein
MEDDANPGLLAPKQTPWNKGKLTGAKPPLRQKHVWAIRTKLHRATHERPGAVQSGHRQQITGLRSRCSKSRGHCSKWLLCRTGNRPPTKAPLSGNPSIGGYFQPPPLPQITHGISPIYS